MKHTNYEQPPLSCVKVAAVDVLLASGGEIPEVAEGELYTFSGPRSEMKWSDIWG